MMDAIDMIAEEIAGDPKKIAILLRLATLSEKDLDLLISKFKEERYE